MLTLHKGCFVHKMNSTHDFLLEWQQGFNAPLVENHSRLSAPKAAALLLKSPWQPSPHPELGRRYSFSMEGAGSTRLERNSRDGKVVGWFLGTLGTSIISLSTEATEGQSPGWGDSASNHDVIIVSVKFMEVILILKCARNSALSTCVCVYIYVRFNEVDDLQQVTWSEWAAFTSDRSKGL